MPPHQKVRQNSPQTNKTTTTTTKKTQDAQCAPQSWKNPDRLRGMKGRSCVLLVNISRGAARIVPHPLQQLLRLKSCPASNYDCIPENRQGNRIPVMFVSIGVPLMKSIRPELASKHSHASFSEGGDGHLSVPGMWNEAETGEQCCRCFSSSSSSSIQQPTLPSFAG